MMELCPNLGKYFKDNGGFDDILNLQGRSIVNTKTVRHCVLSVTARGIL